MHLSPREIEKLMLHNVGFLAQKRLARGVRLNLPEAVALIASQILEFIREGRSVAELMDLGRQLLGRYQVQAGVADLLHEVQVEGTFPDGTKLVTVHSPVVSEHGDLELALYGSFLPVPDLSAFDTDDAAGSVTAGEILAADGDLVLNEGRDCVELSVTNLGDRPVQVGSHYHFVETNSSLQFDRSAAYGKRLDIPAGTAVRFEPGDTKTVTLVAIGGNQVIRGGNNLADGKVSADGKQATLENIKSQDFATT
ncbi:MAG: urease subunit beta [Planctomycetaceae bacterium]